MQLHELPNAVEHVVIFGRGTCHLLDDCGHMPKYGRVQQGWGGRREVIKLVDLIQLVDLESGEI